MNKKKLLKGIVFTLVSIMLLWFLFRFINLSDVAAAFSRVTLVGVFVGFVFYVIGYLIRALRFYYLLNRQLPVRTLFSIVCIHNLMNSLLPARLGELSYVYLVKKKNIPLAQGSAGLFLTRIFDLIALILLFLLALFMARDSLPAFFMNLVPAVLALFAVLILISVALILCKPLLHRFRSSSFQVLRFLYSFIHSFHQEHTRSKLGMLFITSTLLWISQFLMIYFMFWGVLPVNGWYLLIGSLFSILSTVLPVQGIAGFGSIEGAWAVGFVLLGVAKETAIATGFVFHLVLVAYFLVLGAAGWWEWRRMRNQKT